MTITPDSLRLPACRAFRADPVSPSLLTELLQAAGEASSGGNLQPWVVHILQGEALKRLSQAALNAGAGHPAPVYPPALWEPHRSFRRAAGTERYRSLGYQDRDPDGLADILRRNLTFFGAPVGLFLFLDPRMLPAQWLDCGMYLQNLRLAAAARGLSSCPQAVWRNYEGLVQEVCGTDFQLLSGLAIGRQDLTSPLARILTPRRDIAEYVHFHE